MSNKAWLVLAIVLLVLGLILVGVSLFSYGTAWYSFSRVGSIVLVFLAYIVNMMRPKDKK